MDYIFRFFAEYEALVYIVLAIGGLFAFRWMWRAWREWRDSVYGLEREFALQRLRQATTVALMVLGLVFTEFYIATFIVPSLPDAGLLATPTLDLLATPAGTLSAEAGTQAALSPVTQQAPSGMSGCQPEKIMITSPRSGEEIKGTIMLTGSATIPNFGFYKYEVAPLGTANWATISADDQAVTDGDLGQWDTTALANGDYFLQLVIIDNVGKTLEPCVIAVRVLNQ